MRGLLKWRRVYILLVLLTTSTIIHILYIKKERRDFIHNYYDDEIDDVTQGRKLIRQRMYSRTMNNIRPQIKRLNTKQEVHNSHLTNVNDKTYVIVIQCHANVKHLERLLNSLKKTFFINSALLIFSHDHYSHQMNQLIHKIDFAMYMQIFYPYSIQLNPEGFPGVEPISCDYTPCIESTSRDPAAAQSKHHWWWQANQIFDHLPVLEEFTKPILFLDAQDYVIIDALFVFRLLTNAKSIHCPFCEMISLASHVPELSQYKKRKSIVTLEIWKDTMPSTGIAFDRKTWHSIKTWKELFCFYNDSRWENSVKHIGAAKWDGSIYLTAIEGPRVFHLEDCGVKDVSCKMQNKEDEVKNITRLISKRLFPLSLRIQVTADVGYNLTESGYWSDARDHELCMHFANESVWYIN